MSTNWKIGDTLMFQDKIIDGNGQAVDLTDKRIKAKIVTACNAHEDLVEALSQLLSRLDAHGSIDLIREEGPINDAREALASAGIKQ